ncbi:MAG: DUF4908 domain-containing protein [Caulobacteraceae bacterium]
MVLSKREKRGRAGALAGLAGLAASLFAPAAHAQVNALRGALFGQKPAQERNFSTPPVAQYRTESGVAFVVDRTAGKVVLLRFDGETEIWALRQTPGPRGDIIYKNDVGEPMLRATRLGGLTLFTTEQPQGSAAAVAGPAAPLKIPHVANRGALLQVATQASARTSRAAQRLIFFEATEVVPGAEPLFADAVNLTADVFIDLATREGGRALLSRYSTFRITAGPGASASVAGSLVQITVAPEQGFAGRPSSHSIAAALSRRR